ncbi:bifunctional serine/threonine-protein kinase/ABC transporter substrate-binding protein [Streptomyces roseolus]|uniref:bifunctional serine/threonine-protein kinase/ABC transporter substrate-binding protein n=3 Tax=Streptomyces roseolus TaxID=67358 RepID=UPI00362F44B0
MHPLHRSDPSAVAGHRLLGRLGSGGMGVVYLARTPGGALAAVKVIRAEHAADPAFRERFRREARTAERITGRWVVRVLGADPEAREPWLATEYVPGPSLAEAVALHGPLPEPAVRAFGARLADALADLHAAGLVHRDVKPANVLLALDGPRLIDFGIARTAGATALTATDAMIGTPGFLAPEQARAAGAGEVGPPADVFALGCVLAHALTGERPFGTGTVAAVVYRTVHEEPELGSVPASLRPLVSACLAKDPAARPIAGAVRDALGGTGGPAGALLPAGLPALIADRSARVLDLPVPEPTALVPPEPARGPSRRRLVIGGSAALLAGAGGLTAWLAARPTGTRTSTGNGNGDGARTLATYAIGVQTDLSGPRKADGRAQERGARLAVERFNARPDRPFDLAVRVRDDAGDPRRAVAAAEAFGADRSVVALLGPTNAEAIAAAVPVHQRTGLVCAAVATGLDQGRLSRFLQTGVYFEMRPIGGTLQIAFTTAALVRGVQRYVIVEDLHAGAATWYLANDAETTLRQEDITVSRVQTAADSEDFDPVARAVGATDAVAVLYAGLSPRRAGLCARALARAGFGGLCGGVETLLEREFLTTAGPAAEGWYLGASYADPDVVPGARAFAAAYRERWRIPAATPVERYAAEAYDTVHVYAQAVEALLEDRLEVRREGIARRVAEGTYTGVTKRYGFDSVRNFRFLDEVFAYRIEKGVPRCLGRFQEANEKERDRLKASPTGRGARPVPRPRPSGDS